MKSLMQLILVGVVVLVLWLAFSGRESSRSPGDSPQGTHAGKDRQERLLRDELAYLNKAQEIAWLQVEGNDVYIGFSTLPDDWEWIIKGAALRGNKAIDFGCHVWAVDAKRKGWRPGDGPYYGEATARGGRIR